jgi:signal recognition particle GTPase
MGPISKLAGNIPGLSGMLQGQVSDEEGDKKLRRMMYMLDSMTEKGNVPSIFVVNGGRTGFGWKMFCQ